MRIKKEGMWEKKLEELTETEEKGTKHICID